MFGLPVFTAKLNAFFQRRFIRYAVPFAIAIVGGSFGLREFTQLRYQFSKKSRITPEECEKLGVKMKAPGEVTLEKEYEKIKTMDIDNWKQIRGPRPWEEQDENKK